MSDKTTIEWTDASWNVTRGCTRVSTGCTRCYAERQAIRHSGPGRPYEGTVRSTPKGPRWTGHVKLVPKSLDQPLRWKRPRRIFVNSMSDLFHETIPFEYVAAVFGVMAASPLHTFQLLTKRPARMLEFFEWLKKAARYADAEYEHGASELQYASDCAAVQPGMARRVPLPGLTWPLPNVWMGVSCEDQQAADERIPLLLEVPAAVRFVSAEPLLGPIDFRRLRHHGLGVDALDGTWTTPGIGVHHDVERLSWVIVGGESGPGARECNVDWIRDIVRQCALTNVSCFVKQLGADYRDPVCGVAGAASSYDESEVGRPLGYRLKHRKGGDMSEFPADLRVRQMPTAGGE